MEKGSLRLAIMQGLVGPKISVKTNKCSIEHTSKGNQVNIPELN